MDDDAELRALLRLGLEEAAHDVREFGRAEDCLEALRTGAEPDVVVLDLCLPGIGGEQALAVLGARFRDVPVVVLTSKGDVRTMAVSVKDGAHDFIQKPVDQDRLTATVRNACQQGRRARSAAQLEHAARRGSLPGLVGGSVRMAALARHVERVGASDVNVLVQGESGTGKEAIAAAIHAQSSRHTGPFVALNCAAIPDTLQDSALFGHERGSFTGATGRHPGCFERAHGGTLFLDEVAELSTSAQSKLLRVLQERKIMRVGGREEIPVDFRLVAASHRSLRDSVDAGRFREDLYYRIVVFELEVPPLRERDGDVDLLVDHFAATFGPTLVGAVPAVAPEARAMLRRYAWPGNVRELQNALQRAILSAGGGTVGVAHLPRTLIEAALSAPSEPAVPAAPAAGSRSGALVLAPGLPLAEIERRAIEHALARAGGNMRRAAADLGIARTTLYRKLRGSARG
ncbi:MAG: sigma-54-dependent Fis family transcriptional regulator [Myxococcales bacterium]|nr:sigma-54-dependent Fis family transcriptional regulator [Myxococcales bacterium]